MDGSEELNEETRRRRVADLNLLRGLLVQPNKPNWKLFKQAHERVLNRVFELLVRVLRRRHRQTLVRKMTNLLVLQRDFEIKMRQELEFKSGYRRRMWNLIKLLLKIKRKEKRRRRQQRVQ